MDWIEGDRVAPVFSLTYSWLAQEDTGVHYPGTSLIAGKRGASVLHRSDPVKLAPQPGGADPSW
jgi:hypothetical protein